MTSLILYKDGKAYDVSGLVESVKWSGRKGAAARSLSVTLMDDDGAGHDRSGVNCEEGQHFIFYKDKQELFRGLIFDDSVGKQKKLTAVAYDNSIYLANNRDSFTYKNKKASEIFTDLCKRFKLPYATVADTGYVIPDLVRPKTTPWDVLCDALSQTYKATGVRYYPSSKGEALSLLKRSENVLQWVLETGVNIGDYKYSRSIGKVRTRIKLLSKEGKVLAEEADPELEEKIGMLQDVNQPDDSLNKAQLKELAKSMLEEAKAPEKVLTLTNVLGLTDVVTGLGVYINIKELGIARSFYVEEDAHSYNGLSHTMNLKLAMTRDF